MRPQRVWFAWQGRPRDTPEQTVSVIAREHERMYGARPGVVIAHPESVHARTDGIDVRAADLDQHEPIPHAPNIFFTEA